TCPLRSFPARRSSDLSEKLDPRSRRVWLIGNLIGAVVTIAIVAGITYGLYRWLEFDRMWAILVPTVLGALQIAWAFIQPEIEYRSEEHTSELQSRENL